MRACRSGYRLAGAVAVTMVMSPSYPLPLVSPVATTPRHVAIRRRHLLPVRPVPTETRGLQISSHGGPRGHGCLGLRLFEIRYMRDGFWGQFPE